jgi:uncharacterized protein YutE (UPF0331/DUF86 family)
MSPEVVAKKLSAMTQYLKDLLPYKEVSFDDFMQRHYEIERIIELLIMTASDIVFHLLVQKGEQPPATYKSAFLRAGEGGIIDKELSNNLAKGAGLRNILVHEYEEIDYQLLHKSISIVINDFTSFIDELSK